MTPERVAELRARYPSLTAVAELADEVERLNAERGDDVQWGIRTTGGVLVSYTEAGARHHAHEYDEGQAVYRHLGPWKTAEPETTQAETTSGDAQP